jgi:hypothetical protein
MAMIMSPNTARVGNFEVSCDNSHPKRVLWFGPVRGRA